MKKRRPKNRPPKVRDVKRRAQQPAQPDPVASRFASMDRVIEALVEAIGRENVRRASARLGSARSLAALAAHVANGKLFEAKAVTPATVAVEISEHTLNGEVMTESVVAELGGIDPKHAEILAGATVGEMRELGGYKVQVRRAWEAVGP